MIIDEISLLVRAANRGRFHSNLHRRTTKLIEELGELSQAWLNVTSSSNSKQKTWNDVREEIADCLIVALDIAWTPLPNESDVIVVIPALAESPEFIHSMIFDICLHIAMFGQIVESAYADRLPDARVHINRVVGLTAAMALSVLPDQSNLTTNEIETQLLIEVERKLAKWQASREAMEVITDDV